MARFAGYLVKACGVRLADLVVLCMYRGQLTEVAKAHTRTAIGFWRGERVRTGWLPREKTFLFLGWLVVACQPVRGQVEPWAHGPGLPTS